MDFSLQGEAYPHIPFPAVHQPWRATLINQHRGPNRPGCFLHRHLYCHAHTSRHLSHPSRYPFPPHTPNIQTRVNPSLLIGHRDFEPTRTYIPPQAHS